jgi:integrase
MDGENVRDIYGINNHLNKLLSNLEQTGTIKLFNENVLFCEEDKVLALNYRKEMVVKKRPKSTQLNEMRMLFTFKFFLNKPFKQAVKEDIVNALFQAEKRYSNGSMFALRAFVKRFYKWLHGLSKNDAAPPEVRWIELKRKENENYYDPRNVITPQEVAVLAQTATNVRDKSLVETLFESECRIGELLNLKIKDIEFDTYGATLHVDGKTGKRRVRIVSAAPALHDYINHHSERINEDFSEAFVWYSLGRKRGRPHPLQQRDAYSMLQRLFKRAGIQKKFNPHNFRHSRATHLRLLGVPDAIHRQHGGWTNKSNMLERYSHITNEDVDNAILASYGKVKEEDGKKIEVQKLENKHCLQCGTENSVGNVFCFKCGNSIIDFVPQDLLYIEGEEELTNYLFESEEGYELLKKALLKQKREDLVFALNKMRGKPLFEGINPKDKGKNGV